MVLTLKVFTDRAEAEDWAADHGSVVEECARVKYRPVTPEGGEPSTSKTGTTCFAVVWREG